MIDNTGQRPSFAAGLALSCLFTALICAGAYLSIPIGPIPLTLGNFFVILGALLLGPGWGGLSAVLYVVIGSLGFPVFSGGRGGLAQLVGPTGGYLFGYIVGALVAGFLAKKRSRMMMASASVLGFLVILLLGSLGLSILSGIPWPKALSLGVLPFLPGDALKTVLATLIAIRLGAFTDSLRLRSGSHG